MGGDYYDRDVGSSSSSAGYSAQADQLIGKTSSIHQSMDPQRWSEENLKSENRHPIVFALDVTGSMGNWTKVNYSSYLSRLFMTKCQCSTDRL
jgi:hypothetical protein